MIWPESHQERAGRQPGLELASPDAKVPAQLPVSLSKEKQRGGGRREGWGGRGEGAGVGCRSQGGEMGPGRHRGRQAALGKVCGWWEQLTGPLTIPETTCHRPGRGPGPPCPSRPCHLLSWAPQIQHTWGSPRAWPPSPCPSAWTPSPTSCTAPCWGPITSSNPCPPAPATPRLPTPSPPPPRGHSGGVGTGTSLAGQAGAGAGVGARGDRALGGLSSQSRSGQGTPGLAPGPHPRCRHHPQHCPPRMGRRRQEVRSHPWPHHLPLRTGTRSTRPRGPNILASGGHSGSPRGSWSPRGTSDLSEIP